ncbi:MAG: molybdopterin-dependent oxidoreductase [Gemmataceae bacterium]
MYPTATTELADLILPSAMWVEKNGVYGNSNAARTNGSRWSIRQVGAAGRLLADHRRRQESFSTWAIPA